MAKAMDRKQEKVNSEEHKTFKDQMKKARGLLKDQGFIYSKWMNQVKEVCPNCGYNYYRKSTNKDKEAVCIKCQKSWKGYYFGIMAGTMRHDETVFPVVLSAWKPGDDCLPIGVVWSQTYHETDEMTERELAICAWYIKNKIFGNLFVIDDKLYQVFDSQEEIKKYNEVICRNLYEERGERKKREESV
jgi:hypothetical protein